MIPNFYRMIKNQLKCSIKNIRSDNGPEFNLKAFYEQNGISHQKSCVETPEQNGITERKHQYILNVARCLKMHSKLPITFWTYFISYAIHLTNKMPTPLLKNKSPFQVLYNKTPNYNELKSFGCLVYVNTLLRNRTKFYNRAQKGVFLGFERE